MRDSPHLPHSHCSARFRPLRRPPSALAHWRRGTALFLAPERWSGAHQRPPNLCGAWHLCPCTQTFKSHAVCFARRVTRYFLQLFRAREISTKTTLSATSLFPFFNFCFPRVVLQLCEVHLVFFEVARVSDCNMIFVCFWTCIVCTVAVLWF